jgi:hypothetical protein
MPHRTSRAGAQHPEEWRYDLNPDALTGPDVGPPELRTETSAPTAYDVKEVHRLLQGFSDDELKRIPVLPEGSRLEQGATYVDLADPARREFTATGDIHVRPGAYYVPKHEVDYVLWNRLIGVTNPERLDEGNVR